MTKVNCKDTRCKHNKGGVCSKEEIKLEQNWFGPECTSRELYEEFEN